MSTSTARVIGTIAFIGAVAQIAYGIAAIAYPWPAIVGPGGEILWIAANIGMIAGLIGWAGVVARGRTVAIGAAVASLGFLLRIVAAVITITSPTADVLPLVLGCIALTLAGVLVVAVGSLLVRSPRSPVTWLPAVAFAVELGIASMYSVATELHFVLLGLAWGSVSLAVAAVVVAHSRAEAAASDPQGRRDDVRVDAATRS